MNKLLTLLKSLFFTGPPPSHSDFSERYEEVGKTTGRITVIVGDDIPEKELVRHAADLYINNRVYYYKGLPPPDANQPYSPPFFKLKDVSFDKLKSIKTLL